MGKTKLRLLIWTLLGSNLIMAAENPNSIHKIIIDAPNDVYVPEWKVSSRDVKWRTVVPWSVKKRTLEGGKQDHVDLITIENGKLSLTIIPTRGMGLLEARSGNIRLGWDSPVKEVVHPKYINLQSRGGLGWLEGFNEMMVRCGLEFAGHPGKDKFINNTGDEAEMDLTLHGKIGNIPASQVEVIVEPRRIVVRGRVEERMFYGPKLELWTEISTEPGSDSFTVHDIVKNNGAYDQEFQLIYHSNFGSSILEKSAQVLVPAKRVAPLNDHAAKSVQQYSTYEGPTKGFIEQVYCIFPLADSEGKSLALLKNAAEDQGVSLTFSPNELPFFTLWKNTTAQEEGYVTGLEPGTGFPYNRSLERKAGRVPKLKPGESRDFTLKYTILDKKEAVQAAADKIKAIQGSISPQLDSTPTARPQ
jgi:galactose mutarotase-like enzyme